MSKVLGAAGGALSGASTGAALGSVVPGIGTGIGAVVGGVLGGLGGLFGSGVDEQAIEARREAALEAARRQDLAHEFTLGDATARAAASGTDAGAVTGSGSLTNYLASMAQEFRRQNDWNVQQANRGADISYSALTANEFSDIGRGLYQFGAANNWFRSPSVTPFSGPTVTPSYTPGFGMPLYR